MNCPSKLEKADILELAVNYLQKESENKSEEEGNGNSIGWECGFRWCVEEVERYLDQDLQVKKSITRKIKSQLGKYLEKHKAQEMIDKNTQDMKDESDESEQQCDVIEADAMWRPW